MNFDNLATYGICCDQGNFKYNPYDSYYEEHEREYKPKTAEQIKEENKFALQLLLIIVGIPLALGSIIGIIVSLL